MVGMYYLVNLCDGSSHWEHESGRICWKIQIDRYHPLINEMKKTDCNICECIHSCPYSLDSYNTDGDCLGMK